MLSKMGAGHDDFCHECETIPLAANMRGKAYCPAAARSARTNAFSE